MTERIKNVLRNLVMRIPYRWMALFGYPSNPKRCYFYHTMEVPGYQRVEGEWDFTKSVNQYLGGVKLKGKRVLDLGTASGFFSFYMESKGAIVTAYDLSTKESWDIVPYFNQNINKQSSARKVHIWRLNNSFWFIKNVLRSKVKMIYGNVYDLSQKVDEVDISIVGAILLHLRDPFMALQNVCLITKETIVITDLYWQILNIGKDKQPIMRFFPDIETNDASQTWWILTPEIVTKMLEVVGFETKKLYFHSQKFKGKKMNFFTIVAKRKKKI